MLASKEQRTQTPFCESERPLAKIWALLNQIFRGATKAGIPRRISQRTVWAQTGSDCSMGQTEHTLYYCGHVSAALSLGQSGLRLCGNYIVWAQTV